MIREALTERLPPPFKGTNPVLYFGTNHIETSSEVVDIFKAILTEKRFFRNRELISAEYSGSGKVIKFIFAVTEKACKFMEMEKIKEHAKICMRLAFPDSTIATWAIDNSDVNIASSRNGNQIHLTFTIHDISRIAPQAHYFSKVEHRYDTIDSDIHSEVINESKDYLRSEKSHASLTTGIQKKIIELEEKRDALSSRIEKLKRTANHVNHLSMKDSTEISEKVYEECRTSGMFDRINEAENQRFVETRTWFLL